jgi:3-deoxy-manno-octulosonate cytidylyltransferase (CMP-KDO synthetase)
VKDIRSAVVIPARYASTRFPGKVLAKIGNVPMVERVVNQCLKTRADGVYVVTDDERVCTALQHTGVPVVMSAPDIATGTDRVAFLAKELTADIVINVQGDEPFINPGLIDNLTAQLAEDNSLNMITACTAFDDGEDINNTSYVKVVLDSNNYALYFSRSPIPYNRDNTPIVRYKHIGIYGFKRVFLLKYAAMPSTPLESAEMLEQLRVLENGERIKVIKTTYKPLSVDTPNDLICAEEHLKNTTITLT